MTFLLHRARLLFTHQPLCLSGHMLTKLCRMKLIVCAIYGNYRTEIVDDEGIEEIDAYTVRPTRNALDLKFVKAQ
jgi:hypothetical protein